MKYVMRESIWETNSSSMHSVVVTQNDVHIKPEEFSYRYDEHDDCDNSIYIHNGKWSLYGDVADGYGRSPFQILTSFEDKFKYALCEYCGYFYGDEDEFVEAYNMLVETAKKIVPGLEDIDIYTRDVDIYLDEDGNQLKHKELEYVGWDEKNDRSLYTYTDKNGNVHDAVMDEENYLEVPAIGMVDHQSMGMLKNFIKDKGITLEEFLTNKRYAVVIDSDELCVWDKYKKTGLINLNFIIQEYDVSGDDIEYLDWLKEQEENKNGKN